MTSNRQKITDKFLRAAMIGTVAVCLFPVLNVMVDFIPEGELTTGDLWFGMSWLLLAVVILVCLSYSFIYMVWRRRTDEFTLAMWHSGTTVAFFVAIAWLLFGTFVESLFEGLAAAQDPNYTGSEMTVVDAWSLPVILAGFFVGFHFKRLRGDI